MKHTIISANPGFNVLTEVHDTATNSVTEFERSPVVAWLIWLDDDNAGSEVIHTVAITADSVGQEADCRQAVEQPNGSVLYGEERYSNVILWFNSVAKEDA